MIRTTSSIGTSFCSQGCRNVWPSGRSGGCYKPKGFRIYQNEAFLLQGLVLDCEPLDFEIKDTFGNLPLPGEPHPLWIALDEVTDPVTPCLNSQYAPFSTAPFPEPSPHPCLQPSRSPQQRILWWCARSVTMLLEATHEFSIWGALSVAQLGMC